MKEISFEKSVTFTYNITNDFLLLILPSPFKIEQLIDLKIKKEKIIFYFQIENKKLKKDMILNQKIKDLLNYFTKLNILDTANLNTINNNISLAINKTTTKDDDIYNFENYPIKVFDLK